MMKPVNKFHMVEIPEHFLLLMAVHGNMGDGELPGLMQNWAEREVERLGLINKYRIMQEEKLQDLRVRLGKVLGKDMVAGIEEACAVAAKKLTS